MTIRAYAGDNGYIVNRCSWSKKYNKLIRRTTVFVDFNNVVWC